MGSKLQLQEELNELLADVWVLLRLWLQQQTIPYTGHGGSG
jgi:hypothetical protein